MLLKGLVLRWLETDHLPSSRLLELLQWAVLHQQYALLEDLLSDIGRSWQQGLLLLLEDVTAPSVAAYWRVEPPPQQCHAILSGLTEAAAISCNTRDGPAELLVGPSTFRTLGVPSFWLMPSHGSSSSSVVDVLLQVLQTGGCDLEPLCQHPAAATVVSPGCLVVLLEAAEYWQPAAVDILAALPAADRLDAAVVSSWCKPKGLLWKLAARQKPAAAAAARGVGQVAAAAGRAAAQVLLPGLGLLSVPAVQRSIHHKGLKPLLKAALRAHSTAWVQQLCQLPAAALCRQALRSGCCCWQCSSTPHQLLSVQMHSAASWLAACAASASCSQCGV